MICVFKILANVFWRKRVETTLLSSKEKALTGLHSCVRARPCCNSMVFIKVYIVEIY